MTTLTEKVILGSGADDGEAIAAIEILEDALIGSIAFDGCTRLCYSTTISARILYETHGEAAADVFEEILGEIDAERGPIFLKDDAVLLARMEAKIGAKYYSGKKAHLC
jgi:hypothetical protein